MKIIAFGASASMNSINKIFATYVANRLGDLAETLDLNDFSLPTYSNLI